jgi:phosphohistidine phosphatase
MDLFVIRHGVAEARREGLPDAERALTPKGRAKLVEIVRGVERLGVRFEVMLHSPWRRAVETAEVLAPLSAETRVTDTLAQAPSDALLGLLDRTKMAVVGHEPWLTELVAWLALGTPDHADRFVLRKGGIAHLCGDPRPRGMQIVGLYRPRVLRYSEA